MAKTARDIRSEELETYRPLKTIEAYQRDLALAGRRNRAWELARSAADLLKKEYGANRVVAFGSLSRKGVFTPWSDIDLAVWGIEPEAYYSAAGAAMDMGLERGIKIDIVDAESCPNTFLKDIEEGGTDL